MDIPHEMRLAMYNRIHSHDFKTGGGVPYPWSSSLAPHSTNNRARVLACLWLAHEAEEEG